RRIVDPSQAARGARLGERAVVGRTPSATRARIESSWSAIVDEGASTERSTVGVARNVRGGAQWRGGGRRRPEAADVGDPAAAAIRDRAAVLALRRAGRGRAPRTCGERSHEEDDERQGQEATWCHGRLRAKALAPASLVSIRWH